MTNLKLGILGGMGPDATLYTYSEMIKINKKLNPGKSTPHIIINSLPYDNIFENLGNTIAKGIMSGFMDLVKAGANVIGISCNTAHLYIDNFKNNITDKGRFRDNLERMLNVRFIHLIEEAASYCNINGYTKVGLISTPTSKELYQNAFKQYNIECLSPSTEEQQSVNKIINRVLQHENDKSDEDEITALSSKLICNGAEQVILGCTEIPVVFRNEQLPENCLSSISILVAAMLTNLKTMEAQSCFEA